MGTHIASFAMLLQFMQYNIIGQVVQSHCNHIASYAITLQVVQSHCNNIASVQISILRYTYIVFYISLSSRRELNIKRMLSIRFQYFINENA